MGWIDDYFSMACIDGNNKNSYNSNIIKSIIMYVQSDKFRNGFYIAIMHGNLDIIKNTDFELCLQFCLYFGFETCNLLKIMISGTRNIKLVGKLWKYQAFRNAFSDEIKKCNDRFTPLKNKINKRIDKSATDYHKYLIKTKNKMKTWINKN